MMRIVLSICLKTVKRVQGVHNRSTSIGETLVIPALHQRFPGNTRLVLPSLYHQKIPSLSISCCRHPDICKCGYHEVQKTVTGEYPNKTTRNVKKCEEDLCVCKDNIDPLSSDPVDHERCWKHGRVSCKAEVCDVQSISRVFV